MANASELHHNLHGLLLVIGLTVTSFGLLIMGQAIPDEVTSTSSNLELLQPVGAPENGEGEVLAPEHDQPDEKVGLNAVTMPSTERLPNERFSGEGVGRKGPMATSRDDKRAFLLHAAAMARNMAKTGVCELTERPLGGASRACTSAGSPVLIAVSPDMGD